MVRGIEKLKIQKILKDSITTFNALVKRDNEQFDSISKGMVERDLMVSETLKLPEITGSVIESYMLSQQYQLQKFFPVPKIIFKKIQASDDNAQSEEIEMSLQDEFSDILNQIQFTARSSEVLLNVIMYGEGYLKITNEFIDDNSFDQKIVAISMMPSSVIMEKTYCISKETVRLLDIEAITGKKPNTKDLQDAIASKQFDKKCELMFYYEYVGDKETIYLLKDGSVVYEKPDDEKIIQSKRQVLKNKRVLRSMFYAMKDSTEQDFILLDRDELNIGIFPFIRLRGKKKIHGAKECYEPIGKNQQTLISAQNLMRRKGLRELIDADTYIFMDDDSITQNTMTAFKNPASKKIIPRKGTRDVNGVEQPIDLPSIQKIPTTPGIIEYMQAIEQTIDNQLARTPLDFQKINDVSPTALYHFAEMAKTYHVDIISNMQDWSYCVADVILSSLIFINNRFGQYENMLHIQPSEGIPNPYEKDKQAQSLDFIIQTSPKFQELFATNDEAAKIMLDLKGFKDKKLIMGLMKAIEVQQAKEAQKIDPKQIEAQVRQMLAQNTINKTQAEIIIKQLLAHNEVNKTAAQIQDKKSHVAVKLTDMEKRDEHKKSDTAVTLTGMGTTESNKNKEIARDLAVEGQKGINEQKRIDKAKNNK